MRYVLPGKIVDVSRAIDELFKADIEPKLRGTALQDSNAFRSHCCYTESTDAALLAKAPTLRNVFEVYAGVDGLDVSRSHLARLMDADEWHALMRELGWIDEDFTLREASLAFTWARMRVVDVNAATSKPKMQNLSFEDFLDAFVRVATMKALPTDEALAREGCVDAGALLLRLRKNPDVYRGWVKAHGRRWDEPLPQPVERAVAHLLMLLIRTIEAVTARKGPRKGSSVATGKSGVTVVEDSANLSKTEVLNFRKEGGLGR